MPIGPDRLEVLPALPGTEPEEAPARTVESLPMSVSLSGGLPDVTTKGGRPAIEFPHAMPVLQGTAPVTCEKTAGEFADLWRERCSQCVNYRPDLWRETWRVWEGASDLSTRRLGLWKMVDQLARMVNEGEPTMAERATAARELATWGVCAAHSEERRDIVVVHPDARCPEGPNHYRDRTRVEKREGSAVFDAIMRLAQGRK